MKKGIEKSIPFFRLMRFGRGRQYILSHAVRLCVEVCAAASRSIFFITYRYEMPVNTAAATHAAGSAAQAIG